MMSFELWLSIQNSKLIIQNFQKKAGYMKRISKIFALYILAVATLLSPLSFVATAQNTLSTPPTPPMAKKTPKETKIHGTTLVDNYFWLREKNNPEVLAYLEAENAY